jgi:hypothetical protein
MNTTLDLVCIIKKKKKNPLLCQRGVKWLFYFFELFYPSQNNEFLLMWQTQFGMDMPALD